MGNYLTDVEAAKIISVSVHTMRGWRMTGNGPKYLKIGHNCRYDVKDLEDFINESRVHTDNSEGFHNYSKK